MPVIALIASVLISAAPADPVADLSAYDREAQARAVESLIESCEGCPTVLYEVWETTDRFDVRANIVRVFAGQGLEGVPALMRLSRTRGMGDNDKRAIDGMILDALASQGEPALREVAERVSRGRGGGYLLFELVHRVDADPAPYARILIAGTTAESRTEALRRFVPSLGIVERSELTIRAASDPDSSVRSAAAMWPGFPSWSDEDRARWPDEYAAFVQGLRSLVASDDDVVAKGAFRSLKSQHGADRATLEAAERVFRDESRHYQTRVEAMRYYLLANDAPGAAISTIVELTATEPMAACDALLSIEPERIPDEAIPAIVAAMPGAGHREGNFAIDLIVASWRPPGESRLRIGARALPALIGALDEDDDRLVAAAAEALRRFGPDGAPAISALVARVRSDGSNFVRGRCVTALLAIDPDHAEVRAALTELVQDGDESRSALRGNTLRDLMRIRPDAKWVRSMAEPAMESPEHALHESATHFPPAEFEPLIDASTERLVETLSETRWRDEAWAFVLGELAKEPDPHQRADEYERRERAADLLGRIDDPSDAAFEGLLRAIRSEPLETPQPPSYGEYQPGDRRAAVRRAVWEQERRIAFEVANSLASAIRGRPERFSAAIDALADHPAALSFMIVGTYRDGSGGASSMIPLPEDLDQRRATILLDALLPVVEEVTAHRPRQTLLVGRLGALPTDNPRRVEMLVRLTLWGAGEDGPPAALRGVGLTRPMTPELLAITEDHLDDPRRRMRWAAVTSAGLAGPAAARMLDRLLEMGRDAPPRSSIREAVMTAVRRIDPDDARVLEFIEPREPAPSPGGGGAGGVEASPAAYHPGMSEQPVETASEEAASGAESPGRLEEQRRANRDAIAALGVRPYGGRTDELITLAQARLAYDPGADEAWQAHEAEAKQAKKDGREAAPATDERPRARVAGRVVLKRDGGKLVWLQLRDHTTAPASFLEEDTEQGEDGAPHAHADGSSVGGVPASNTARQTTCGRTSRSRSARRTSRRPGSTWPRRWTSATSWSPRGR